jgi:hypothetical protein
MLKMFQKLLIEMRTRIRILRSGSIKKLIEMHHATDSESGRVRICELYQTQCECMWIRIPESGFKLFMRTPDSHRIRTIQYGPPPPDPIGLELLLCKGYSASTTSEWTRQCYTLTPDHTILVR